MRRFIFGALSAFNRTALPRLSRRPDLTRLKGWEKAMIAWRMWVTYNYLDTRLPR